MNRMRRTAQLAGLGSFFAGAAGLAVLALAALTPGPHQSSLPLTLAVGQGLSADHALALTPPDLDAGRTAAAQASALAPYDSSARLRLAYMAALDGELGPDGVEALRLSYELLPFDQYVAVWRVRFALDHWGELTPEIRARVESEAFAFARTSRSREMTRAMTTVRSPIGAVPATFWRIRMERERRQRILERRAAAAAS